VAELLGELAERDRIEVCCAALSAVRYPGRDRHLLDTAHLIARHADHLARTSSRATGGMNGSCRPDVSEAFSSLASGCRPTSPGGVSAPSGAFGSVQISRDRPAGVRPRVRLRYYAEGSLALLGLVALWSIALVFAQVMP
jgi:hypothetical protein